MLGGPPRAALREVLTLWKVVSSGGLWTIRGHFCLSCAV